VSDDPLLPARSAAYARRFTVSTTVTAALLTIRPGAMREMHWDPDADE
jgi:oxalate decarboxylase